MPKLLTSSKALGIEHINPIPQVHKPCGPEGHEELIKLAKEHLDLEWGPDFENDGRIGISAKFHLEIFPHTMILISYDEGLSKGQGSHPYILEIYQPHFGVTWGVAYEDLETCIRVFKDAMGDVVAGLGSLAKC
jgi:hypothetical protein